jgi:Uma2 family endonuclease
MAQSAQKFVSPEEYLAWEEDQQTKHEYFHGRIYAMTGGSLDHAAIILNLGAALLNRLRRKKCRVFVSGTRVKVDATGLYTYPDVTVVCGEIQSDQQTKAATLLNPTLIIEVLSSSTEAYDRGDKFRHYRQLPSLTDYILISTTAAQTEHFQRRSADDWLLTVRSSLDATLTIDTLNIQLPFAEIYEFIEFPAVPVLVAHANPSEEDA